MPNLDRLLNYVVTKIEDRIIRCGRELPPYMQKQAKGIKLYKEDPERALAILADGIRDEMDYIEES